MPSVLWFRRDLRRHDNPALLAALAAARADGDDTVVPLFVLDPRLWGPAGDVRRARLSRSLHALDASLGGALVVRHGDPVAVVPEVAGAAGATTVHVAADFGPYGSARDRAVAEALATQGRSLVRTGSPYAVAPGRVVKDDGTPYRVYTPFHRAWEAHGWRAPADDPDRWPSWRRDPTGPLAGEGVPAAPEPTDPLADGAAAALARSDAALADGAAAAALARSDAALADGAAAALARSDAALADGAAAALARSDAAPAVGEEAALARWDAFREGGLASYADLRDRPDVAGTSSLSAHLRWGEIHPRTLLADLDDSPAHTLFRKELAWREFYADVLHRSPASARTWLDPRFALMEHDEGPDADERFDAWCRGRTGYPFVDAGMRQLAAEGWMHNRVRMVTASFLVKDLHLPWQRGARWFMGHLRDGDLASNQHGWQWVAGSGTDAAPYFRVFNPVTQGLRFDPEGDYVRRYVAELAGLPGAAAHEPWKHPLLAPDYPPRVVDHAAEREESLRRHAALPRSLIVP